MNDKRLKAMGGELGVTGEEIRTLKRMSLDERIMAVFEGWVVKLLIILSGILGISIGRYYCYLDSKVSYPGSYEPPGGMLMPLKLFAGAAGLGGLAGAGYVLKKEGKGKQQKLFGVLAIVAFSFIAFAGGYVTSAAQMTVSTMYGVYSREQKKVDL